MSVISAEQFKNKATRIVAISGFEEGEKIEVRIRPVSLTAMMMQGRISNELKSVAFNLFEKGQKAAFCALLSEVVFFGFSLLRASR